MTSDTATKKSTVEIEICADCVMASTYGISDEYSNFTEDFSVRYVHAVQENDGHEPIYTGNDEGSFSWSSCDFCDDRLGGMRYTAEIAVVE